MTIHPHQAAEIDQDFCASLVFSGGIGLGSYQAGACDALLSRPSAQVSWIAGSSIGALNGAMVAGSEPSAVMEILRAYWLRGAAWGSYVLPSACLSHAANWMSALHTRLFGSLGRLQALGPRLSFSSFYDLTPTVAFLRKTIDFGRLNNGDIRFTVATTDIESGEVVLFDTGKGDRIGMDHLMASCGFLPEFAPVEIGGRLLGDGGLAANAPFEPILDEAEGTSDPVFILDLFARDGRRPTGLESALARKNALVFGNQTWQRLEAYCRHWDKLPAVSRPPVLYLSYFPVKGEAGPEMPYDFSPSSAHKRWSAGRLDMEEGLARMVKAHASSDFATVIRRPDSEEARAAAKVPTLALQKTAA
ncbi:patatin-like phospholipase family protein [Reyranella sp.]|uniref:patatin-like phospholipase family protein n=1 Tax=Reyranella sp. TaxID=1929291 RepID=UPI003D101CA2